MKRDMFPDRRNNNLPNFFDDFFSFPYFDDFFDYMRGTSKGARLDVKETENDYKVDVDVPGFNKEDINISIEGDYLVISGKQQDVIDNSTGEYIRKERRMGSFSRTVPIPENVKLDNITAKYNNGVLCITLPKEKPTTPKGKRIDIE
jgi:HSP20 family protein